MRILYLSAVVPWPVSDGDKIRAMSSLRGLSRKHRVFGFFLDSEGVRTASEVRRLVADQSRAYLTRTRKLHGALRARLRRQPIHAGAFWFPEIQARLVRLVRKWRPEIVHVHRIRMMPYAEPLGLPYVLDMTDCMSHYYRHAAHLSGWRKWYAAADLPALRRAEARWANRAAASLVITEVERARVRALGVRSPVFVVPNALDLGYWKPCFQRRDRTMLVFLGNMGYPPNVRGLAWFIRGPAPALARSHPRLALDVVGDGAPADLLRLAAGCPLPVRFVGSRSDVRPCLYRAAALVCPLPVASGLQNKAIQAMACGLPVVATRNVARAIGAVNGREIVTADRPASYARALAGVLDDPRNGRRIALRARRLIERKYAEPRVAGMLDRAYAAARRRM